MNATAFPQWLQGTVPMSSEICNAARFVWVALHTRRNARVQYLFVCRYVVVCVLIIGIRGWKYASSIELLLYRRSRLAVLPPLASLRYLRVALLACLLTCHQAANNDCALRQLPTFCRVWLYRVHPRRCCERCLFFLYLPLTSWHMLSAGFFLAPQ